MSVDYYKLTKDFLVNEGQISDTNILTYVQALSETIANMRPRSQAEGRPSCYGKATTKGNQKICKANARKQ